jgi:hypothetical protein
MTGNPAPRVRTSPRSASVRGGASDSATKNRKALKAMTEMEAICGVTLEEYETFHAAQRARVRARYGLKDAA